MTFTTIVLAPSLTAVERWIAMESGPRFMDSEEDCAALLEQSRWSREGRIYLTAAYLSSMRSELDGMKARAEAPLRRESPRLDEEQQLACRATH